MENEPEVIRDQMQETRTALTEKIEALEQKVSNTVEAATSTVTETVQNVTEAVQDTVGTVKDTVEGTVSTVKESVRDAFDLPGHVQRHPWVAMAGSVAVGYVAGRLMHGGDGRGSGARSMAPLTHVEPEPKPQPHHNGASREESGSGSSLMSGLLGGLSQELDKLKDLGLSALMAVVRDVTTRSMPPEIGSRLHSWVDEVTEHMGVTPLRQSLIPETSADASPAPAMAATPAEMGEPSTRKGRSPQQSRSHC
jgi:ElaB/YqjD/DUF883 family membrane-anchored ribosome-binding protein